MKISTKGRYGLRILLDLALHSSPTEPRGIKSIAESQQISEKYISKLIIELRKGELVKSVRGVKGGFHINRYPEKITILEILEVMEGPLSIVDCIVSPNACSRENICPTKEIWSNLNNKICEALSEVTLQDLIDKCKKTSPEEAIEYCI